MAKVGVSVPDISVTDIAGARFPLRHIGLELRFVPAYRDVPHNPGVPGAVSRAPFAPLLQ
jgi:hypothetical protein